MQSVRAISQHPVHMLIENLQRFDVCSAVSGETMRFAIQPNTDNKTPRGADLRGVIYWKWLPDQYQVYKQ
jgi:hypothetical protein